ncbi:polysaccharide lyase 6 family protein [Sediminitomix flava]|uniref:Poly(Beta-D-mannuronate) lyase n=1 Tax=Sediminitomix flava TaxID=379075 RepID=A0A315ZJ84_SEDFL|nr:polysaccharide lyase 6 family protein [Sediminitomix flava]PWJ44754.1 poly(beta-D-mannuronate) lyase [Sediminitomix flava]
MSKNFIKILLCGAFLLGINFSVSAETYKVSSVEDYNTAVGKLAAGDTLMLANGVWTDAQLIFKANGTAEKPVVLCAETKGKVTLEGKSDLRLVGNYLVVDGLVFKNGSASKKAVIRFSKDKEQVANYSRVTNCVISYYNKEEKLDKDHWVELYGRYNRLDHNLFEGKSNVGPVVVVILKEENSRNNHHSIDNNHFKDRITTGSNGGETIRIGTSFTSLEASRTVVRQNYFERCNGEVEVVSNKSCENKFLYNTFFECEGSLVLRHGHNNWVEGNYFIGNNVEYTGGVRVINEGQTVVNNYFEGITGRRFRAALAVMNGIPNSPANRYMQVLRSTISQNTFIDCDHIELGVGSDEERTLPPSETVLSNNLFLHSSRSDIFGINDDVSGIQFSGNVIGENIKAFQEEGFTKKNVALSVDKDGIKYPSEVLESTAVWVDARSYQDQRQSERTSNEVGAVSASNIEKAKVWATLETAGVKWWTSEKNEEATVHTVKSSGALYKALATAKSGDVLKITATKLRLKKPLIIDKDITIQAANSKVLIEQYATTAFEVTEGVKLELKGLKLVGKSKAKYAVQTLATDLPSYLTVTDCEFSDYLNAESIIFNGGKMSMIAEFKLQNSVIKNINGHGIYMHAELDDKGRYNVERLKMKNVLFTEIKGIAVDVYRGGMDESTMGPVIAMDRCSFINTGSKETPAVTLHGLQGFKVNCSVWHGEGDFVVKVTSGGPVGKIEDCNFSAGAELNLDPAFTEVNLTNNELKFHSETLELDKTQDGRPLGYSMELAKGDF